MSFDMFYNKQNDDMDPNYIYPRPYIDPMMYANANPYSSPGFAQMNPAMNPGYYMSYMNPYMANPALGQNPIPESGEYHYEEDEINPFDDMMQGMPGMQNMQGMPMMPGMFPNMMAMMMPGMMPMMQGMPGMPTYPFMPMMPGMSPINIEEFDEEEM